MIDFALVVASLPTLLKGAVVTLQLASLSCIIGTLLGTLLGILQASKNAFARWIVTIYVTIVRGTPVLIQLYIVVYLFPAIGISLPYFWSAVVAIGLNSAAYVSQIIKLGIQSVGKGQLEAAHVLGFSSLQKIRFIILPQALRTVLPALGNELITLIKETSLASVIGVVELTKTGSMLRGITLDVVTIFAAVGLMYLVMTGLVSLLVHYLEKRLHHAQN